MVGKVYDYDKSYENGHLKYWQIELGLEDNKYDHDLREWENSLIFTSHDGNDEDKLKVILLKWKTQRHGESLHWDQGERGIFLEEGTIPSIRNIEREKGSLNEKNIGAN